MPVWFIFFIIPVFFFCFVFGHETTYTVCKPYYSMYWNDNPSVKAFKTRKVHLVFSLVILVFAPVIISSITTIGMFSNHCLVLLLLLVGQLSVQKFDFQLKKINLTEVQEMVGHCTNWQMAWQLIVPLHDVYSDKRRSFNQWQCTLYPNFVINQTERG